METQTLQVEVRESRGKGPARQLRMKGQIPAVFYGPGVDTKTLAIVPKELKKALATPWGLNTVLKLDMGGHQELAMVKEVHSHPVDRTPLHVDFYRVSNDREVTVRVPFGTKGRALGVQKGGVLQVVFRDLPVRCTPDKIPSLIELDVSSLDTAGFMAVKDLPLPEGVRVLYDPDRRVVLVGEERVQLEETDKEAAATPEAAAAPEPPKK